MTIIDRRGVSVSAVDTPIAGDPNPGLAVKAPCLVATTGDITLSGLQVIDGVQLADGNRVLVRQQLDPRANGLYNASSGLWQRTIDCNSNDQLACGMQIVVTAGDTYAEQQFTLTAPDPVVLGTSSLGFSDIMETAISTVTGEIYAVIYGVNPSTPDNAAALLAARDAAVAAGYATVVLPAGTIKTSSLVGLNTWAPPGKLTVPGLKVRGQGKGVTIIDTSAANAWAFAVNPAWRGAYRSALLTSAATIGGTLTTNTYYVQITVTDDAGNEVYCALPRSYNVTGPTGAIAVPLDALNSPGYSYNVYCDTVNPPAHYASIGGSDAHGLAGSQTVTITALGSAHAVPVTKISCWQEAEIRDLTITSSSGTAGASGILYFKAGYADIDNIECLSLKGDGIDCLGYTGDSDGSFNVRILKSKLDTVAGWGINAAGAALELSNFKVQDCEFNLCGTAPADLGVAVTINSITNSASPIVGTSAAHGKSAGDQIAIAGVLGMALPAGDYRVGETVTPTTFNLVDLNGAAVNTTALGAYTANSGTLKLRWRPPRYNAATASISGSGGLAWLGLIGTFRNLDFTQCNNVDIYTSEAGSSDNATFEAIDMENTAGKGAYFAGLLDGSWNGGEVLSTASLGATIAGFQFGTGFPGGGVVSFDLRNLKVRSDVAPSNLFEQFPNTNIGASYVDGVRIDGRSISYQSFALARQQRYVGFNFPPIEGQCQFSITGANVATLKGIGYGQAMPMHLGNTNGDGEWVTYQVPAAGLTLAIAGPLAPTTLYHFYYFNSAAVGSPWTGTMAQPTLTAPVISSPGGYRVRADDPTQVYIGDWTTDGSGNFQSGGIGTSWYPSGVSGVVVNAGSINGVAYYVSSTNVGSTLAGADGQLLLGKTSAGPAFGTMSGDATISNTGAVTIAGHAVSSAKFRQGAALSVVGNSTNATADVADIAAASDNTVLRRSGTAVGFGSLDLSQTNTVGSSILAAANGGVGGLTAHGVVIAEGASAAASVVGGAGKVLQGQGAGSDPVFTSVPSLGSAGSQAGGIQLANLTSGTLTISPPTGAMGTVTNTLQAASDTFVYRATADTLTNKTINGAGNTLTARWANDVSGLGAGVATAGAVAIGTVGGFITNGGALGSPLSIGTLPGYTLGGNILGGGNALDNIVIGGSTPLAGTFTALKGNTSTTTPLVLGGTAAGSTLTLQSTSGVGAGDAVNVALGNNGAKVIGRFTQTGLGINTVGNPVVDLQVGGVGGTNAGFEVIAGTTVNFQFFNRNTSGYAPAIIAGSQLTFQAGTPTTVLQLTANTAALTGVFQTKQGSVAVANGLNSNISTPSASWVRLTGPTGAFSIGGFTGGADGQELVVYNTTAQTMTIVNEDASSTAGNRLKTLTGANVVLRATATSSATFRYDATDSRWILTATN